MLFLLSQLTQKTMHLCQKIMQKIIAGAGGFFCGDTEDFTPVVKE